MAIFSLARWTGSTARQPSSSSPSTPPPSLPTELILYILDLLVLDFSSQPVAALTISTAKACCRVSRVFLSHGRTILYTRIRARFSGGFVLSRGLMGLAQTLAKNHDLADMVEEVSVPCEWGDPKRSPSLCTIVLLCPRFTTLSLHDLVLNHRPLDDYPFEIIGQRLESLHVGVRKSGGLILDHYAYLFGRPLSPQNVPHLRRLSLEHFTELREWQHDTAANLTHLKFEECSSDVVQTLVRSSTTTLESLHLHLTPAGPTYPTIYPTFDILPRLTKILLSDNGMTELHPEGLFFLAKLGTFLQCSPFLTHLQLELPKLTLAKVHERRFPDICGFLPESIKEVEVKISSEKEGGKKVAKGEVERVERKSYECSKHGTEYVLYGFGR